MTDYDSHPQERIAREHFHDAFFLGVDGEEAAHYWSTYHRTLLVIEADGSTETYALADTPCDGLTDWVRHTAGTRGWATDPRVTDRHLVDDLGAAVC